MTTPLPMAGTPANVNLAGLTKNDYRGNPSTLCQGCGHNSIANQIVADPKLLAVALPCKPATVDDPACARTFAS